MGCAILRSYLKRENNNIARALARYNGSTGKRWYSDKVIDQWTRWNGADDLGRDDAASRRSEDRPSAERAAGSTCSVATSVTFEAGEPSHSHADELFDRGVLAAGQHFDAAIGEVAREARQARATRALRTQVAR